MIHYIHRAININGLIGTVGGYVGLCLGYSLLQLPDLILYMMAKYKSIGERIHRQIDIESPCWKDLSG